MHKDLDQEPVASASAPPWLVVVGPTGVGKSAVADILARRLSTDVITADSMQIYQQMDIGTGKPLSGSQGLPVHHLIDLIAPDQGFSAGAYRNAASEVISELQHQGKSIVIEGGTGLYLKALLYGLWKGPPADQDYRNILRAREKEEGEGTLHRLLETVDLVSSETIHFKNVARIIRALEVYHLTGRPLSESHREDRQRRLNQTCAHLIIGLRRDRKDLCSRIDARVDEMIDAGFVAEVEILLSKGYEPECQSMLGLGYRQIIPYLQGRQDLNVAISLMKQETRRFAKRQMTWFRADKNITWLDMSKDATAEDCADTIMRLKKSRSMI